MGSGPQTIPDVVSESELHTSTITGPSGVRSSKVAWKWKEAPQKTTIL